MLHYDRTKPSLVGFMDWLRKEDPERLINFNSLVGCPCARYSHSLGMTIHSWAFEDSYKEIHTEITKAIIIILEKQSLETATYRRLLEVMK